MQNQNQPQIDLEKTSAIKTEDGSAIFQQGIILRKVSKFITGGDEDAIMPIPIFYDPKSMKILKTSVPLPLREEYKDELLEG